MQKDKKEMQKDKKEILEVKKGWNDVHIHVLYQTIIITGGYLLTMFYKNTFRKFGKRKIRDTELIFVTFIGTAVVIYLSSFVLNIKLLTYKIY